MKPDSVKKFDMLYLGGIALGVVNFALAYERTSADVATALGSDAVGSTGAVLIGGMVFALVIALTLWFLASRLRIGLVKYAIAALVAFGFLYLPEGLRNGLDLSDILSLVSSAMQAFGVAFLFRADARAWFVAKDA